MWLGVCATEPLSHWEGRLGVGHSCPPSIPLNFTTYVSMNTLIARVIHWTWTKQEIPGLRYLRFAKNCQLLGLLRGLLLRFLLAQYCCGSEQGGGWGESRSPGEGWWMAVIGWEGSHDLSLLLSLLLLLGLLLESQPIRASCSSTAWPPSGLSANQRREQSNEEAEDEVEKQAEVQIHKLCHFR